MKKIIIAALMAGITTAPALAAPYQYGPNRGGPAYHQGYNDGRHDARHYQAWRKGQHFDSRYAPNYRVIVNPRAYRLHDAPRGYRWVRSGNDAVLVGITSGLVAAVMANMIR